MNEIKVIIDVALELLDNKNTKKALKELYKITRKKRKNMTRFAELAQILYEDGSLVLITCLNLWSEEEEDREISYQLSELCEEITEKEI